MRIIDYKKRFLDGAGREQLEFIYPLFNEVYERAKKMDMGISRRMRLYIKKSDKPAAFSIDSRTVVITTGMLSENDDMIREAIGHAIGEISEKYDADEFVEKLGYKENIWTLFKSFESSRTNENIYINRLCV